MMLISDRNAGEEGAERACFGELQSWNQQVSQALMLPGSLQENDCQSNDDPGAKENLQPVVATAVSPGSDKRFNMTGLNTWGGAAEWWGQSWGQRSGF